MLANLKISVRLSAVLGVLTLVLLLLSGFAVYEMRTMNAAATDITRNWLPSVSNINKMLAAASELRAAEFEHVINTDNAKMQEVEQKLKQVLARFDEHHKAYKQLISSDEERKLHDAMASDWDNYMREHEKMLVASRSNQNEEARALLEGASRQAFLAANAKLDELAGLNAKGSEEASRLSDKSYADAVEMIAISLVLGLGVVVAGSIWLVRSITGPLAQAVEAVDKVASGDLSGQISVHTKDEVGLLMQSLATMQAGLIRLVQEVRQNSESVATASSQIAQGNQDLSSRTEEQASALQQTAATMEQLGTTVRNNADSARQANQLAQNASTVANQGGEVVSRVVSTMQGINDSSRKIGDIISVIDGIAFQTNILALNAAVEAARAGEQGRGFAVVAGEVRTLAQRSAEAAKEIKLLIGHSVEQVNQGSTLVDQAGKTMDEIMHAIQRVSDIVGEISSASQEQSTGVQQVCEAVGQMDQATQQNAALVEESAAAAESLKGQAHQLVKAVASFTLAQDTSRVVASTVSAPHVFKPITATKPVSMGAPGALSKSKAKVPAASVMPPSTETTAPAAVIKTSNKPVGSKSSESAGHPEAQAEPTPPVTKPAKAAPAPAMAATASGDNDDWETF